MSSRILIIRNPASRGGRNVRCWRSIETALRAELGPVEIAVTAGPGDGGRIAQEGVRAGAELVIAAGGDGTVNEVVNGLLGAAVPTGAVELAVIPLGTGDDFARSLGIRTSRSALRCFTEGSSRSVDIGRVVYRMGPGRAGRSHFVNVGSAGLSAAVAVGLKRRGAAGRGCGAFLRGVAHALRFWQSLPLRLSIDGETVYEGPADLAAIANGSHFGGGMRVAPLARLDDGLFDIVLVRGMPRRRLVRKLPRLYWGGHIGQREVLHFRGRQVELVPAAGAPPALPLELDGEPRGALPASFELLPGALQVRGFFD